MPADRVFRRSHSVKHAAARSLRQQKKISPVLIKTILMAVGLGLAVATIIVTKPTIATPTIRTLDCTLIDTSPCPETVIKSLQPLLGQPLLFSSLEEGATGLLAPMGFVVKEYSRVVPETFHLVVAPLDVLFYLEYQDQTVAISANGTKVTMPATSDPTLVRLSSNDPVTNQQLDLTASVPHWLLQTVKDLSAFFATTNARPVKMILRTPFELQLNLVDQSHPMLINPQESALNLARLSSILKSNEDSALASPGATLDVRFRLPVLRR